MTKALYPFGPSGFHSQHWNWCRPNELVGTHGGVCLSRHDKNCGCGVSFTGIYSNKATSQAIVIPIEEYELDFLIQKTYQHKKKHKGREKARHFKEHMDWLLGELWKYPIGQILLVEKVPDLHLIPNGEEEVKEVES